MSAEDEVRAASRRFYAALNSMANGDASAMAEIWEHGAEVTVQHPIGGRSTGWGEIDDSWHRVAAVASDGRVELLDQRLHVIGDAAIESGVEKASMKLGGHQAQAQIRVTNVYRRAADGWKMVHHHADPSPEMLAAVSKL